MTTVGMSPEQVRAIVVDRWDQATVRPDFGEVDDGGSGIHTSPVFDQLYAATRELAARIAGGEVQPFGMSRILDETMDLIRDRLCEWAVAYTLGDFDAELAKESGTAAA
jgi:hypothetical protein